MSHFFWRLLPYTNYDDVPIILFPVYIACNALDYENRAIPTSHADPGPRKSGIYGNV